MNDNTQSVNPSADSLLIGGVNLHSRLFVGTGKFSSHEIVPQVLEASGSQVVTMALRRVD
ncbi:thiazole synthase domain protein, partial [Desulfosporosinus sp. OT]